MTTLLGRLGHRLAIPLAAVLVRCQTHGPTPWVPTCTCVLEGQPAAEATPSLVVCGEHVRLAEEGDPAADEDLEEVCLQCLVDRGILPGVATAA